MRRSPQTHQGRDGEAEGAERLDREQMDNVSFDFVLQHIVHLRLKYSNWGFVFKEAIKADVSHCHFLDNSILIELGGI